MKHSFKRILSLVLTFAMVLSCVPAQVFATETCEHSYEVTVTEPTCTEDGSIDFVCSLCGDSYSEPGAAAEGHDYQEIEAVEATCSEAGSATYECTVCGETEVEEIPATGEHSYADGVCACGAEDPDAVPAEEPIEEPAEEPAEEPIEEPAEELTEQPAPEPADADGDSIVVGDMGKVVAQLGEDGETFTSLAAAIAAASAISAEERPFISVLADCTVEETIYLHTGIAIFYIGGDGNNPTITAADGVDTLFEIGKNGDLLVNDVDMVTNGAYIINLTGNNSVVQLGSCNLSGATEATINVEDNVNWSYPNAEGWFPITVQIYSGSVSGATALHLGGRNASATIAMGAEGNPPAELSGSSADGVIVLDGDGHRVEMYGTVLNNAEGVAFTMNGDSSLLAGGATFNGNNYDDPWGDPMPQNGAVARTDYYFGSLQSALDAAHEGYYEAAEGEDTSDWTTPLTVLEPLTISDTITIEETQFPLVLRGEDITLTENGAIHVKGHVRLENYIYMGLGTVYVPEGGELEWWGGDVIGHVTWPGETDDHLSAYWVHDQGEGWFENIYQYHPNSHWIRMVPGENHFLSFYKNVWDGENGKWIRTPVAPGEMDLPEHITVNPLSGYDWISFRDGEANAANFVALVIEPDMPWDTHPVITVDGIPFTVDVQRDSQYGFYSGPEATNENWLTGYRYNKFREEDGFYFIFTNDDYTLKSVSLQDNCVDLAVLEVTEDPNVWKITLTDAAHSLDESINDYHNFDVWLDIVVEDGSGNEHHWNYNIYCEPWIWNVVDGGEMTHADLMFVIDAQQNVNDWAGAWIHESVTTLDPNVNGGVLDIDMGVREDDNYERVFVLEDNGKIIVPDGCTLIINSPTAVTGGLIEVQEGGQLIVNRQLHIGTGTVYMENGAGLTTHAGISNELTWEDDPKDDFISASYTNSENNVFYAIIDEFGGPNLREHEMLPGDGNPMVFFFNHWNGEKWERTPIHPSDLWTDDGLTISSIEDVGGTIREDQEYGDCFLMLWAKDDDNLWDTVQYVYYNDYSFAVRLQRDKQMGFYSTTKATNQTFLDSFGFGPGRDNTFYFIVTDKSLTASNLTAQLEAGPNVLEGGVTVEEYADNIWKIQLADEITANTDSNYWLRVRMDVKDNYGNTWRTDRGIDCHPWTWGLGMSDAGFGINGLWYQYYADADTYMAWIEDDSYEYGGYRTEVKLPEGVSYDITTNTMTLNNATMDNLNVSNYWWGYDENGDFQEGWDLPNGDFTLKLIGENRIGNGSTVPMWLGGDLNINITGDGSLYVFNNNEGSVPYQTNAAEVYDANLTISGSAKVTFHVEGANYWEDGSPAWMVALMGSGNSTLRVTDNAVLTMEVPEITRDERPGNFTGIYQGLVNFGEVIVEKQATLNLDSLELSWVETDGERYNQVFHLNGGTVNVNAHPSIHVMDEETGELRYYYDAVLINEGGQLNVNGGKLNVIAEGPYEGARYTGFKVTNGGNLYIFGGSINLSTNALGPAIHVGGPDTSWLYMGGGTFTYTDHWTGEQKNTLINVEDNSRARFFGGTIVADGGTMNLMGMAPEGEMEAITWNGTALKGTGTHIVVHGNLRMSGGLIQLNEGRMEVENSAVFDGGTLAMNDSVMIVNGAAYAEGNAKLNFHITDKTVELFEDNTAIEINNYFVVQDNAQVNVDVSLENIKNAEGYNIPFSGIRNHAAYHQMGGTLTINSNAYYDTFSSYGNILLNAGEMNLTGASGIQQNFNEDMSNIFFMEEGVTLNVEATRCGIALANAQILGGTMNIVANGENGTFGLYSVPEATVDITGGIHSIVAHSSGEGTVGIGVLADISDINVSGEAVVSVEADEAMTCWMVPDGVTHTIYGTITDANGIELNNWKVYEDNTLLVDADGAAVTEAYINASAAPKTLQEILPYLGRDNYDGSYMLAQPVMVNESMRLVDADGNPVQLHVLRGGKITVRSGAVLTIPAGGQLIAHNNWEENDIADGTIIVEAGGQILNNGLIANDGGYISIQSSSNKAGYVHGGNAVAVSHFKNGEFYPIQGADTSCQELNANIGNAEELQAVLNEANNGYASVYIWTPDSMSLDGITIPENTELAIDGQEETAYLTVQSMTVEGQLSLGNVDLTVNGGLHNFGVIQTDIHDNAKITLNGDYFGGGGRSGMDLNRAQVTINGTMNLKVDSTMLNINDGSVVTVTESGFIENRGSINVGYWKMGPDEVQQEGNAYAEVAGTLNVEGQINVYNAMNVAPDGETSGGVVNIEEGGSIFACMDDYDYGVIGLEGELNVQPGGTLVVDSGMGINGTLNVAGDLYNRNVIDLFGEMNISGNLFNQMETDAYYGSINLYDNGKLIGEEDAYIENRGGIRNSARGGIVDVEKADFYCEGSEMEVCMDWFDDGALAQCKGIPNDHIFLVYEGDDASAAINMANYSAENGYRGSIVRVVGNMEIGYNQSLICDYLVVMPGNELEVNGFVNAHVRLFVRQGAKLTVGTNGWIISDTEMVAFAGDDYYGNAIVENRGTLECSTGGYMGLYGDYDDFGVGTIYNILHDGVMGDIYGVGTDRQTLFATIMGSDGDGEQQLRDIIDQIRNDGYGYGIINVLKAVDVSHDLEIPENVRVRITEEGDYIGSMTVYNGAYVNNMGTIVSNRPYAALLVNSGSYGGSGLYYGYCGNSEDREALLWHLENGVMTISGTGAMADYAFDAPAPWLNLNVSKVVLGNGVTYIGDFAFQKCNATIVIPKGLQYFGTYCFSRTNLKVYHNSAAEAYLKDNYDGDWSYIHEVADGVCIVEGCDYGLESILNDTEIPAEEKKEELKNSFDADSLKEEMEKAEQDKVENGTENTLIDQLAGLEEEILKDAELGVSVDVEEGVEDFIEDAFGDVKNDASILGAVLNAEEGVSEVKLVLGNPEDAHIGDEQFGDFNADASVLFSMTLEGVGNDSQLDIPVKITLPVPANIGDLTKLVVMHYHDGSTEGQKVKYTLFTNEEGKAFVSFVITGFSNFLIGEKVVDITLTAKVNPAEVTKGTDPDAVQISISRFKDLSTSYIIEDEDGNEVELADALQTPGTYNVIPTYVPNSKYNVTVKPATLTVNEVAYACVNTVTGESYEDLEAALEATDDELTGVVSEDTIQLVDDCTAGYIIVPTGTTLDLNGHDITARAAVAVNGAKIIDSYNAGDDLAAKGKLVVGKNRLTLDQNNSMIPVYTDDGYVFASTKFALKENTSYTGEGYCLNALPAPEVSVIDLFKDGVEDNNLQIKIRLTWGDGDGIRSQEFAFKDSVVASVYQSNKNHIQTSYGLMFKMIITGIENVENLEANIVYVSGTNAEYARATTLKIT